jgi:tetratricopeptide (TPR) repeat protein
MNQANIFPMLLRKVLYACIASALVCCSAGAETTDTEAPGANSATACADEIINLTKKDRLVDASKLVYEARQKFPDDTNIMTAAAFLSYSQAMRDTDPAKRDLYSSVAVILSQRAIEKSPDNLIANKTLGLAELAMGDPADAITPFRRCVELEKTPENLVNLVVGLRMERPGNDKQAARLLRQALIGDSQYVPALIEQAGLLLDQKKLKDASLSLQQIPEGNRDARWLLAQGDLCSKEDDKHSALAAWNAAIRLDPFLSEVYQHMANYYVLQGKAQLAEAELHRGLEVNPYNKSLRIQLSQLLSGEGQPR